MKDLSPENPIILRQLELGAYLNWLTDWYGTPGLQVEIHRTKNPEWMEIRFLKHYTLKQNNRKSDLDIKKW
jgi:hypothetical protein